MGGDVGWGRLGERKGCSVGRPRKLLFIEPQQPPTREANVDAVTRKMCGAFRRAATSEYAYGGVHTCRCGAHSTNVDYVLPDGSATNSLCVHYVAHHRSEVPAEQLRVIESFATGEAAPDEKELQGPEARAEGRRQAIRTSLGGVSLMLLQDWGLDVEALVRQLESYGAGDREHAGELLGLLRSIKPYFRLFAGALKRLGVDRKAWGARALRLPRWDREAWAEPLVELLRSCGASGSELHTIAWLFRYVRGAEMQVPVALQRLSETGSDELRDAARVAIEQFLKWEPCQP